MPDSAAPWLRRVAFALCVASLPLVPTARAQSSDGEGAAPLARALDSIRADRIAADVAYVACDEMGGRDTPSTGQRLTARFLKNRLQRMGWKPGARDGWFQNYTLVDKRVKEPDTKVTLQKGEQKLELEFARDYFFNVGDVETLDATATVVFCGRGTKEELAAAPAVKGKWALCLDGGDGARAVEPLVRAAGALGLVLTPAPDFSGKPYEQTCGAYLPMMRTGTATWPEPADPKRAPYFPRLFVTKPAADRMLALAGVAAPTVGQELPVVLADTRRLIGDGKVTCENVCAYWPGSDPQLSKEVILVSAHYDHLGTGTDGQVFNGADDNGSGTCALLALAEALVVHGPMRRSVLLVWVSGEEKGLYGSQAWSNAPWCPDDGRPIADVNVDMVGRNAPHELFVTPSQKMTQYNGLVRLFERIAPAEQFTDLKGCDDYYHRSDQKMFARLGIPVVFLFAGVHADYHQPSDKPEKIDGDKVRRVARVVLRMLNELQTDVLEIAH
jgi:hypothetical protein